MVLQLESGRQLLAFPLPDGAFSFAQVPVGVHTLTVDMRGLVYPTVRLDVGAARKGKVAAVAADATGVRRVQGGTSRAAPAGRHQQEAAVPAWQAAATALEGGSVPAVSPILPVLPLQAPALPYPLLLRPYSRIEYFEVGRSREDMDSRRGPCSGPVQSAMRSSLQGAWRWDGNRQARTQWTQKQCGPGLMPCIPPRCRAEAPAVQPVGLPEDALRNDGRLHGLQHLHHAQAEGALPNARGVVERAGPSAQGLAIGGAARGTLFAR